jgi:hypothetical protein
MTITNNDIKDSLFVIGKNQITGEISRIAVSSDMQIGLSDKPAELQLLGRLSLNVTSYQINIEKTYDIGKDDCVSLIQKSDSYPGTNIDLRMPSSPRKGQIHIIKDSSGTAADVNIVISTRNGSTFDGETSLTLSSAYSSTILFWNGNEWNVISSGGGGGGSLDPHASTHIRGGSDQINGDLIDIDFSPIYYTSSISLVSSHIEHLASHLQGIDDAIGTKASITHASTHIRGGSDQIDGDLIDIDFSPINYTSSIAPTSTHIEHLASHLKGIDNTLGNRASSSHASTHIRGGSDQIDGDLIGIDFSPTYYIPTTSSVSTNTAHLASHLLGIDNSLSTSALLWEWNGVDTSQFQTASILRTSGVTSSDSLFGYIFANNNSPLGNVLRFQVTGSTTTTTTASCVRLIDYSFPQRFRIEMTVSIQAASNGAPCWGLAFLGTDLSGTLSAYTLTSVDVGNRYGKYRIDSGVSTHLETIRGGTWDGSSTTTQIITVTIRGNKRSGEPPKFIFQSWSQTAANYFISAAQQTNWSSEPAPSSWNNLACNRIGIVFLGKTVGVNNNRIMFDILTMRIYGA